ncbi:ArsI/CadI family heavy metal resistance metalloenzyme [Sporichthya sp.]|uniref:ArsI/CadI family heavy metal resistance metalloenzyme n=1 Tax=Sporichthya sp. TaxID=65475 RepID=UPI0025D13CF0|nr:ArsI/CadI family heavy metal resistance metalloenzyme [Sporichthya sp.]
MTVEMKDIEMHLQLALNVDDLDEAIDFYSRMFGTSPVKVRPGYANFVIADPPLKFILFAGAGAAGTINHLGVETETAEEVSAADARLRAAGLQTTGVDQAVCCYAEKAETWLHAPDGNRWEWYVKKADVEQFAMSSMESMTCSAPAPGAEAQAGETSCCPA